MGALTWLGEGGGWVRSLALGAYGVGGIMVYVMLLVVMGEGAMVWGGIKRFFAR